MLGPPGSRLQLWSKKLVSDLAEPFAASHIRLCPTIGHALCNGFGANDAAKWIDRRQKLVDWMTLKFTSCLVGALLISLLLCAGLFLPLPPPNMVVLADRLQLPTPAHLLGTDELGRDLLSRLVAGTRYSILTAAATTTIAVVLGWLVGRSARSAPIWIGKLLAFLARIGFIVPRLILSRAWLWRALATLLCVFGIFPALWASVAAVALWDLVGQGNSLALGPAFAIAVAYAVHGGRQPARDARTQDLSLAALIPIVLVWSAGSHAALDIIGLGVHSPDMSWGSLLRAQSPSWWPCIAVGFSFGVLTLVAFALSDLLDARVQGT